jgi:hypothetical protein
MTYFRKKIFGPDFYRMTKYSGALLGRLAKGFIELILNRRL